MQCRYPSRPNRVIDIIECSPRNILSHYITGSAIALFLLAQVIFLPGNFLWCWSWSCPTMTFLLSRRRSQSDVHSEQVTHRVGRPSIPSQSPATHGDAPRSGILHGLFRRRTDNVSSTQSPQNAVRFNETPCPGNPTVPADIFIDIACSA